MEPIETCWRKSTESASRTHTDRGHLGENKQPNDSMTFFRPADFRLPFFCQHVFVRGFSSGFFFRLAVFDPAFFPSCEGSSTIFADVFFSTMHFSWVLFRPCIISFVIYFIYIYDIFSSAIFFVPHFYAFLRVVSSPFFVLPFLRGFRLRSLPFLLILFPTIQGRYYTFSC